MAFLGQAININQLPNSDKISGEPVPNGVYCVSVERSELKTTNAGTGRYIALMLRIIEGEYSNRVVFDNVNISNPSEECQNIGLAALKNIMSSLAIESLQDTDQLIGGRLVVKLGQGEYNGEKRNKVKEYQSTGFAQQAPAPMAPPAPPANHVSQVAMGHAPMPQAPMPGYPAQPNAYAQAQQAPAPGQPGYDLPF